MPRGLRRLPRYRRFRLGEEAQDELGNLAEELGLDEEELGALTLGDPDEELLAGEAEDMLHELSGEEIIGLATIGYPVQEIIGAMPPQRRRLVARKVALAKARGTAGGARAGLTLPTAGSLVETKEVAPRFHRLLIMGVPATDIALGATVAVEIKPQRTFKIKLLSVPSAIAEFFALTDVKVGQDSVLAGTGEIPCQTFSEVAVNADVDWHTANIGHTVTLFVKNIDPTPAPPATRTFRATVKGLAVL